jgi:hypothetical protein
MALFTASSPCAICRRPVGEADIVSFGRFVANAKDPLYAFRDAICHAACVERSPVGQRASFMAAEAKLWAQRKCVVCGRLPQWDADGFHSGMLSSDESAPVSRFNFVFVHRCHFADWGLAAEFTREVSGLMSSAAWAGPKIVFEPAPKWDIEFGPEWRKVEVDRRPKR